MHPYYTRSRCRADCNAPKPARQERHCHLASDHLVTPTVTAATTSCNELNTAVSRRGSSGSDLPSPLWKGQYEGVLISGLICASLATLLLYTKSTVLATITFFIILYTAFIADTFEIDYVAVREKAQSAHIPKIDFLAKKALWPHFMHHPTIECVTSGIQEILPIITHDILKITLSLIAASILFFTYLDLFTSVPKPIRFCFGIQNPSPSQQTFWQKVFPDTYEAPREWWAKRCFEYSLDAARYPDWGWAKVMGGFWRYVYWSVVATWKCVVARYYEEIVEGIRRGNSAA